MTTSTAALQVERRGAALWLRLDRPKALNGINDELLDALEAGLDVAEADDDVRLVVVAAQGRVFCAGADLVETLTRCGEDAEDGGDRQGTFLRRVGRVFSRIETLPKPVIAAVHGLAVAGGLELVLACDLVVAARSATFGDAHANYGLIPGGGGSVRLPRRVGPARAKHLMFTGGRFTAEELACTDLITSIVDDDHLQQAVDELVAVIARKSPTGLSVMKRLVADGLDIPQEAALAAELGAVAEYRGNADFQEGIRAFTEKRAPVFPASNRSSS
ncbi:enoyl-CoA hydratase/isomerase family protein [Pseudonocardia kujensis]|uniref:enoyl-CoA hydratase/isomerase family protein n=1 Tax=Pseudonocardia kujensis TaxID=1128675 RepID=UPI001E3FA39C|nr:enoyl-CoA hydratase/isomerase family protein [Pseudonocardia kujensis]MCE0762446.1 enoyl-CoA hydratase/isomerase family protein [Pseudonocardia kujensis]